MMDPKKYSFDYEEYDGIEHLKPADALLLNNAREVTRMAYAPYSNFRVGAVAKLANGQTVTGTNQENASYPVGICAERSLLATAAALYPEVPIHTMAISYHNLNGESNRPVSPCGMCRQALTEFETRTKQPMRLILGGMEGKVYVIEKAHLLLPLSFGGDDMK